MFLRCLSSCDLNLSTEQEDTMHTYLGNLLNILICNGQDIEMKEEVE